MNNLEHEVLLSLVESSSLLSGQFLADKFSVSRNAIWKVVNSLKEQGYPIESEKRGYRLAPTELIFPEAFRLNGEVKVFDEIGSTNEEVKRSFTGTPLLVVAKKQTNGKGKGDTYFPSPETGLYFTYMTKKRFSLLSFHTLKDDVLNFISETFCVERVNQSLMQNGTKVGGVIVETTVELDECTSLLVGVGFYPPLDNKVQKIERIVNFIEKCTEQ